MKAQTNPRETDLYRPVKAFFETLGYEVKAEIGAADVVAVRDGEAPVIIELKTGFSLTLLQQAVARQKITDQVYVAVPRWKGRNGYRAFKGNLGLCKRLGLGVITVGFDTGEVQIHHDPAPFQPRKVKKRQTTLMAEFERREGDPNKGGAVRSGLVTSYRQEALRCAAHLAEHGASKGAMVAQATGVKRATRVMADNHYGWFERVDKGIYQLSEAGIVNTRRQIR
ncbi:hypothetical protein TG4357_01270 [Thalassovita gelatinovora]|uniref:Uncharacterized protein n=1 Tax=Thalassovita gelatinovora TaxID=53501 RepID=A0A0N7LUT9_THAGE|nr:DUF2161 family putative PD-(D/E)XK-type phosphodiesterase [Thalassovita gelatinovora]QIZ81373.1 hypothetical protein HFZ77_13250 [Thalassovita gelatinovora]CUH64426.1 hypothetical protein TG4357_01270 [Thalassovita gelatinovora]SEP98986.1 hypothetical protein SAMN04488043_102407 [Thalassovita gelatinovora]